MTRSRTFLLCLLLLPGEAAAQHVTMSFGAGNVATHLSHSARVHTTALRKALRSYRTHFGGTRLGSLTSDPAFMNRLRTYARSATIADLHYTTPGGQVIRVHARSGWAIDSSMSIVDRRGGGRALGWQDAEIDAYEALLEYNDRMFYPPDTPSDIWAQNLHRTAEDVVEPSLLPGQSTFVHKRDAEIKAMRRLEAWIQNAPRLRRGGTLVAYVSKAPCASCAKGFTDLANGYQVNVQVFSLDERHPERQRLEEATQRRSSRNGDRVAAQKRLDVAQRRRATLERIAQDAEDAVSAAEAGGVEADIVRTHEAATGARAQANAAANQVESETAAVAQASSELAEAETELAGAAAAEEASRHVEIADIFADDTGAASQASSRWLRKYREKMNAELLPTGVEGEDISVSWADRPSEEGFRFDASAHAPVREWCGE